MTLPLSPETPSYIFEEEYMEYYYYYLIYVLFQLIIKTTDGTKNDFKRYGKSDQLPGPLLI